MWWSAKQKCSFLRCFAATPHPTSLALGHLPLKGKAFIDSHGPNAPRNDRKFAIFCRGGAVPRPQTNGISGLPTAMGFAPKIVGRGNAPPLQRACKHSKLTCHCEERSDVAIRNLKGPLYTGKAFAAIASRAMCTKINYCGLSPSIFSQKVVNLQIFWLIF